MIHLRGVERADLDALFALDQKCFAPGIAYSRAGLRYYLNHPRSFSVLVEDATKSILGFAIAESHLEEGRRMGHIITIDVSPIMRRNGLGRLLMEALLDHLRALTTEKVRLEVSVDNVEAHAFYRNLGFVETGRIRRFYLGKLDALAMEKPLL